MISMIKRPPPLMKMRPKDSVINLQKLIQSISGSLKLKESVMIEIGSFVGESTVIFAASFAKVIAIDPFIPYTNVKQDGVLQSYKQNRWNTVYNEFVKRTAPFGNVVHLKKVSDDAFKDIQEAVHFVYIDGTHTYEQCKKDIKNYLSLIKPEGFIAGHDYTPSFPGVKKAVDDVLGAPDAVFGTDGNWIKKMSNIK
jgi:hypothetical protein